MRYLDKIKNEKIHNYMFRSLFFLIITISLSQLITVVIFESFIMFLYGPIFEIVTGRNFDYWNEPNTLQYFFMLDITVTYYFAKVFGIFSKLKEFRLNNFNSFLIIFFISLTLEVTSSLLIKILDIIYIPMLFFILFFISFLIYLFFNLLTKKFPTPFKQIGYISSLECYKNLFLKLKEKIIRK